MGDHISRSGNQRSQSASCDYLHRLAALGPDPLDDTLDQPDIAPKDAGLHRRDGAAPNHGGWAADPNPRQLRGCHIEGAQRQMDAGSDYSAAVIADAVDDIEGRRRPEIE